MVYAIIGFLLSVFVGAFVFLALAVIRFMKEGECYGEGEEWD